MRALIGGSLYLAASILVTASLAAQLTPIGLSEVRSRWFENATAEPPNLGPRTLLSDSPAGTISIGDGFSSALAAGDFNGDGAGDLAIGVPGDDDPSFCPNFDCGTVVVRYGARGAGLGEAAVLRQDPASNETEDLFGWALAAADFDHDGFDDLAVGAPGHGDGNHGAVFVYYGSIAGLAGSPEGLGEAAAGELEHRCDGARFGEALTVGDFDGDLFADLVVGVPKGCERVGEVQVRSAGSVFVFHGHTEGLLPFYGYRISQNSIFIFEECEIGDAFAAAVAAADFDGDSHDDLAIGIPGEDDGGAMEVIFGSVNGLIFADSVFWYPEALGETTESGDEFGAALAAGRFDGDAYADLAIGIPREDLGSPVAMDAGVVSIAYGGAADFDLARTDHLARSSLTGLGLDDAEYGLFGYALAAGDFDGDGIDDFAIGILGQATAGQRTGAAAVVMGSPGGLGASSRYRLLAAGLEGQPGVPQAGQAFGLALVAADFDGRGFADLAVGAPSFDGAAEDAGGVLVLYGALFADGFEIAVPDRWTGVQP
jgi:hypothetical protein